MPGRVGGSKNTGDSGTKGPKVLGRDWKGLEGVKIPGILARRDRKGLEGIGGDRKGVKIPENLGESKSTVDS